MPSDRDDKIAERDPALIQAEEAIAEARQQMVLSLGELQREVARTIDWREWVRRKPIVTVSLAFGLGLWLGRRH